MLLLITLAPRCFIHPRRTKQYSGAICKANRRGDRVVYGAGLENQCGFTATGGSNPSLSVFYFWFIKHKIFTVVWNHAGNSFYKFLKISHYFPQHIVYAIFYKLNKSWEYKPLKIKNEITHNAWPLESRTCSGSTIKVCHVLIYFVIF